MRVEVNMTVTDSLMEEVRKAARGMAEGVSSCEAQGAKGVHVARKGTELPKGHTRSFDFKCDEKEFFAHIKTS